MKKLRIAVIGTGHLGTFHAKEYTALSEKCNIELVGVCDIDKARAEKVAAEYNTRACTDYHELLDKADAVSIVVPTSLHYEISRAFLKSGVDVLVEKPITKTLEEANEIVALAAEKDLLIQVGHIERFNSAVMAVEPLLEKPRFIECQRLGSIQGKGRITDVGVVLDLMIHDIDIILSLVRSEVKKIEAVGMSTVSEHEDLANVRLTFANDVIADITASRITKEEVRKIRIFQEKSYILLDFLHQEAFKFQKRSDSIEKKEIEITKRPSLQAELDSFITCVRSRKKPVVSGEEGRQALAVALKILDEIKHKHSS